jgi:hypothetical protein
MLVNICDVLVANKKKEKKLASLNIIFALSVIATLYGESVK